MGEPRESWLRSDDHDKFAAAAAKCKNPSAACIPEGACLLGGCFRSLSRRLAAVERELANIRQEALRDE